VKAAITPKTKAIVPVHLYGQSADMEPIMKLSDQHGIYVIEDNAQALGAQYSFSDGRKARTGTIGHIGCTSFYPSKNLGCYGDGGAIMTNDDELADTLYKIANHGQSERYYHDIVGCNSRLDSIQAVVLSAKLKHLDQYNNARLRAADAYDQQLSQLPEIILPSRAMYSTHVFHQYTLRVSGGKRDALKAHLDVEGIPNMIYYPLPLYHQKAFQAFVPQNMKLAVTEQLCAEVISLPIHSEMNDDQITYISDKIKSFFSTK
jgi:dTDP-4-amino-4,6-dideoxygalactose transaminase